MHLKSFGQSEKTLDAPKSFRQGGGEGTLDSLKSFRWKGDYVWGTHCRMVRYNRSYLHAAHSAAAWNRVVEKSISVCDKQSYSDSYLKNQQDDGYFSSSSA